MAKSKTQPRAPAARAPHPRAALVETAVLGVAGLFSLYLLAHLVSYPYGRDQAIFAYVAERVLDGKALYREAWDLKWPGIYALYAAVRLLLGRSMAAIRVTEALLLVSMLVPHPSVQLPYLPVLDHHGMATTIGGFTSETVGELVRYLLEGLLLGSEEVLLP